MIIEATPTRAGIKIKDLANIPVSLLAAKKVTKSAKAQNIVVTTNIANHKIDLICLLRLAIVHSKNKLVNIENIGINAKVLNLNSRFIAELDIAPTLRAIKNAKETKGINLEPARFCFIN
jgi:hypothetical protein